MYHPRQDSSAPPRTIFDLTGGEPLRLPALPGETSSDVAIVGGGLVGCSAALHLAEMGRSAIVIEANEIGWGSARRSAGQVSASATKLDPAEVLRVYGPVHGPRLNEAGAQAPEFVSALAERYGMDISIVRGGILRGVHTPAMAAKLRGQAEFWQRQGAPVEYLSRGEAARIIGSDFYLGAQIDRRGIAVNPLAWVRGLARAAMSLGARLHENTRMDGLTRTADGWRIATPHGAISAGQVLLCTNAYTDDAWPGLKRTIIPVRGYQIWTRPLGDNVRAHILRGIAAMNDTRRLLTGMRLYPDGRLHFSGGVGFGAERAPDLEDRIARVRQILPDVGPLEVEGWWSGWVTRGIADGWRLHRLAPGLFTAIACNGRGVAMGPIMGRELARCAAGVPESELLVPLSAPKSIPWHPVHALLGSMAIRHYARLDRREIAEMRSIADTPA
ncbi:MAG: FAD-binding oxidoreductase [Alphaproteobacteria bacterium]|nr:FAD-binding oxidoreductase [Alphaproteobacteria bacterium]